MKAKDDGTSVEQTKVNMVDSWRLVARAIWNCPSQFWSVMFCRDFYGFFSRIFCRRTRHSATDEGKDEERWTGLVSLLPLEADDDNRDDDDEFQIRKEGEGNADEKEFFISR